MKWGIFAKSASLLAASARARPFALSAASSNSSRQTAPARPASRNVLVVFVSDTKSSSKAACPDGFFPNGTDEIGGICSRPGAPASCKL